VRLRPGVIQFGVVAILFSLSFPVGAQQPTKVPRIGFITGSPSVFPGRIEAFREGLRELGYVEGTNIAIEYRYGEGRRDRLPALAAELVRLKVDIIVSGGPTITGFLKEATTTIPIVMGFDTDPVGNGLVANLARPGGNITGLSVLSPELGGKRLELLKEIVPKLSRLVVLGSSTLPGNAQNVKGDGTRRSNLGREASTP
jgi:putative ABC transport system substrate-binding protein